MVQNLEESCKFFIESCRNICSFSYKIPIAIRVVTGAKVKEPNFLGTQQMFVETHKIFILRENLDRFAYALV